MRNILFIEHKICYQKHTFAPRFLQNGFCWQQLVRRGPQSSLLQIAVPAHWPHSQPVNLSHSTSHNTMSASVLEFWLSSLNMSCYYQSFIDNGYDDLEISKKVGFWNYNWWEAAKFGSIIKLQYSKVLKLQVAQYAWNIWCNPKLLLTAYH